MKLLLATTMLAFAIPAIAQTPPSQTSPTTAPAPGTPVPDTVLSTAPTPSTGPRAQEGNLPSNSAADANNSPLATDPTRISPAPALANYPICTAGQFDDCMEPGNGARHTTKKRLRKSRR